MPLAVTNGCVAEAMVLTCGLAVATGGLTAMAASPAATAGSRTRRSDDGGKTTNSAGATKNGMSLPATTAKDAPRPPVQSAVGGDRVQQLGEPLARRRAPGRHVL